MVFFAVLQRGGEAGVMMLFSRDYGRSRPSKRGTRPRVSFLVIGPILLLTASTITWYQHHIAVSSDPMTSSGADPLQGLTVRDRAVIAADPLALDPSIRGMVMKSFSEIYKLGRWGGGSGMGSSVRVTETTRAILQTIIKDYKIKSMADTPCGALEWMPPLLSAVEKDQPGFRYFGGDIVPDVIESNVKKFGVKHPNWSFQVFDITAMKVPSGYELIHCRDSLQHLELHLVVDALEQFAQSDARLLAVGSYDKKDNARNFRLHFNGDFFPINLRESPFLLDRPLRVYNEKTSTKIHELDKWILVYDVGYLKRQDYAAMRERVAEIRGENDDDRRGGAGGQQYMRGGSGGRGGDEAVAKVE